MCTIALFAFVGWIFSLQRTARLAAVRSVSGVLSAALCSQQAFILRIPMTTMIYNRQLKFPLYRRLHWLESHLSQYREQQH